MFVNSTAKQFNIFTEMLIKLMLGIKGRSHSPDCPKAHFNFLKERETLPFYL